MLGTLSATAHAAVRKEWRAWYSGCESVLSQGLSDDPVGRKKFVGFASRLIMKIDHQPGVKVCQPLGVGEINGEKATGWLTLTKR